MLLRLGCKNCCASRFWGPKQPEYSRRAVRPAGVASSWYNVGTWRWRWRGNGCRPAGGKPIRRIPCLLSGCSGPAVTGGKCVKHNRTICTYVTGEVRCPNFAVFPTPNCSQHTVRRRCQYVSADRSAARCEANANVYSSLCSRHAQLRKAAGGGGGGGDRVPKGNSQRNAGAVRPTTPANRTGTAR